ncbi:MAG TPA: NAD(P)-binding domain-containing protein [Gemmatimonadales bacterium]
MSSRQEVERIQTVVIGGGQAGLSVGYELARRGLPFLILDANERVGDPWRRRWDSLRLFTPARYDGLAGFPFPAKRDAFITKDEMADYLESYAARFRLPVRHGARVDGLSRRGDRFLVTAGERRYEADQVVVAMANYQVPRVPDFAPALDSGIVQLHSRDYRSPSQLASGGVLVVGVGNSGADIALETARTHATWLAGKEPGHVPFRIEGWLARHFLVRVVRFVGHRVLTRGTPIGRRLASTQLHRTAPLVRVKPADLTAAGVVRVPRVVGVREGRPLLADDRTLDVATVIWCTGFQPGFSWIHLPVLGDDGLPRHERGVVVEEPGLYFVGLHFLYAMSSDTVNGVGRDAEWIARAIAARVRDARPVPRPNLAAVAA